MELKEKVAIITGAASGIGEEVARTFAREGAAVSVVDSDSERAEQVVLDIRRGGGRAIVVPADVGEEQETKRVADATAGEFGAIDILINNAATQSYGSVETMASEEWDRILRVNLKGPFLLSKYSIPFMKQRDGGAIVNIGSVQSLAAGPTTVAYVSSKHGIVGLTRSMALDLAEAKIRVNCVCPGAIDTPMLRKEAARSPNEQGFWKSFQKSTILGRVGRPEEIAEMVLFLAGARGSYNTGGIYVVDGGMLAPTPGALGGN